MFENVIRSMLFAFLPVETRYKIVNDEWPRGTSCQRIETKAECEQAARQLGLSDTTANEGSWVGNAPYCGRTSDTAYTRPGSLRFNKKFDSKAKCSGGYECLCKQ